MLFNFLPLVDWANGVLQSIIMFTAFLILIIVLVRFMLGGKKKNK